MLLYKYLSPERIDVLENKKIRFTQPGDLNDPFEFEPYIYEMISEKNIRKIIKSKLYQDYITHNAWAKNMPYELFELLNYNQYKGLVYNILGVGEKLSLQKMTFAVKHFFAILSLSRKYDNKLMWSHYAKSGKGFVIGFDTESEFFSKENVVNDSRIIESGDVLYSDLRPTISLESLQPSHLFFAKSLDWEYEKEYRFVKAIMPDMNEPPDSYPLKLYEYPVDCVKEIYIGSGATSAFTERALSVIGEGGFDAKVYKMTLSQTEYRLQEERIR